MGGCDGGVVAASLECTRLQSALAVMWACVPLRSRYAVCMVVCALRLSAYAALQVRSCKHCLQGGDRRARRGCCAGGCGPPLRPAFSLRLGAARRHHLVCGLPHRCAGCCACCAFWLLLLLLLQACARRDFGARDPRQCNTDPFGHAQHWPRMSVPLCLPPCAAAPGFPFSPTDCYNKNVTLKSGRCSARCASLQNLGGAQCACHFAALPMVAAFGNGAWRGC